MMSYINTLHVSSAREAVVFYHQVKIIQIRLKPRRKKKISVLKNFRKRVGRALDFAKER